MADETPFDLEEHLARGTKTPVWCCYCDEQFPFRKCRLFILDDLDEDEHVFMCEPCYDREIAEPLRARLREQISEAEVHELGEKAFRAGIRDAGNDREARRRAIAAWVGFQLAKREQSPPGDPRIN